MLIVIPCGGLGNRLMAMIGAKIFAEYIGCEFNVSWRPESHLNYTNCPISALFEGIDSVPLIANEPAPGFDYHHHVPGSAPEVEARLKAGETVFLHSYCFIQPEGMDSAEYTEELYRQFERLKPLPELIARVPELPEGTIGIQSRHGDHWRATRYSPISLFFRIMDRHCGVRSDTNFYLSTDSPRVRRLMRKRFGSRILTLDPPPSLSDRDRAPLALVKVLTLARTSRLYHSYMSSFGFIAHLFSRCPLICVGGPNLPGKYFDSASDRFHDRFMEFNQESFLWQKRPLPRASPVVRLQAELAFFWTRVVCSKPYQLWPFHRLGPVPDPKESI